MKKIWIVKASSKVIGSNEDYKNTILLSAHYTEAEAIARMDKLEVNDNYLTWCYEIESVILK